MKPSRFVLVGALLPLLAGCSVTHGGGPLVSAQYPPGTGAVNDQSQPQPVNSLPPGAANVSPAVGATQPNYAAFTFGVR